MATRTVRASGPQPPAEVWERYADPGRWSQWSPQIRRVDASGRLRPGLTGSVHSYAPPAVRFRVLEVDEPGRTWRWEVRVGPVRMTLDHGVEAAAEGSTTWLRLRGPLPVVLAYAPLAQLALQRLVR